MLNIQKVFPTLIATTINPNHSLIEEKLIKECFKIKKNIVSGGEDWVSNKTYNTLGKHNIFFDKKFNQLNTFVLDSVNNFCDNLDINKKHISVEPDSWFNIYNEGDYQEYHRHPQSIISVVYFLKSNKDSAKIYFKSPVVDMMPPIYNKYTFDTFERIHFEPVPGLLLIFRSYLEHCVEKQKSKEKRITLAYNF